MIVESYEDVIYLSGALRSNFWETVHTAISLTLKRHPTGVIIECSGITECTPEGAETFRDILVFIEEHDARVICVGVPANVMEVLKQTPEVRSRLPVANTVEEARNSLDLLEHAEPAKRKASHSDGRAKIVLLLTGDERDEQGLAAGKRIADGLKGELVLTFVIVVPRDLPIQAPMPDQEERAVGAMQAAQQLLDSQGVPNSAVAERGRDVASALESVIEEQKASFLLIPLSPDPAKVEDDLKLARSALTKVSAQVAFIRGPLRA